MSLSCLKPSMAFLIAVKIKPKLLPLIYKGPRGLTLACLRLHVLTLLRCGSHTGLFSVSWRFKALEDLLISACMSPFFRSQLNFIYSGMSCLMTHSKESTQSFFITSHWLILCIALALWYFLRAGILASHYYIPINLQICNMLLLLVTTFTHSKYFWGLLLLTTIKAYITNEKTSV